jgi:tetratricopeptide (TPR) repeat protein
MSEEPTPSEIQLKIRQLLGQATLQRSRGDLQQGLALAQEAVALDDDSWEAHELVGDILLALQRPEQAMESYRRARERNADRSSLEEKIGRTALARAERDRTSQLSRAVLDGKAAPDIPKRSPSYAALYSFVIPGLGQVYNREVAKGVVIVVLWMAVFALAAMTIRSDLALRPPAPMGTLYPRQIDLNAVLAAAFSGPSAIWTIGLVLIWIYAVADAAIRASKTMTSDHTGVV